MTRKKNQERPIESSVEQPEFSPQTESLNLDQLEAMIKERTQPEAVGEAAATLRTRVPRAAREESILRHVSEWARAELSAGRAELRKDGKLPEVLVKLNRAVALMPWSPSVELGKAFTLLDAAEKSGASSLTQIAARARSNDLRPEIQGALLRAREKSAHGSDTWRQATRTLAEVEAEANRPEAAIILLQELREAAEDVAARLGQVESIVGRQVLSETLASARFALRHGLTDQAERLAIGCVEAAPNSPAAWTYIAETLMARGRFIDAAAVFRFVAAAEDTQPDVNLAAIRALKDSTSSVTAHCARCHAHVAAPAEECPTCGLPAPRGVLVMDKPEIIELGKLSWRVRAAWALHAGGEVAAALDDINRLLLVAPSDNRAFHALEALRDRWRAELPPVTASNLVADVAAAYTRGGRKAARPLAAALTVGYPSEIETAWLLALLSARDGLEPDALPLLARAPEIAAGTWAQIPLKARMAFAASMLASGLSVELHPLLDRLFSPAEQQETRAAQIIARCRRAIEERFSALVARCYEQIEIGMPGEAVASAQAACDLLPNRREGLLARGWAYLETESPHAALQDFRQVWEAIPDDTLAEMAALGTARAYLLLEDVPAALDALEAVPAANADAESLRASIHTRLEARPFVLIEEIGKGKKKTYRGVFGVRVEAAARWFETPELELTRHELGRAGADFITALGGLATAPGQPTFDLRIIARPIEGHPAGGELDIALLVAVTHPIPEKVEHLALETWHAIQPLLPMAGQSIYRYEPISTEEALRALLDPFEIADAAEFARREVAHDGVYGLQMFTTSGTTLLEMTRAMLRRPAPSMISVLIQPTTLLTEERGALAKVREDLRNSPFMPGDPLDKNEVLISELPEVDSYTLQDQIGQIVDGLEKQAFLMQARVASADSDPLLQHNVAACLFGAGGQYHLARPADADDFAALVDSLRRVDLRLWIPTHAPDPLGRLRWLFGLNEASLVFRLPMPGVEGIPGLPQIAIRAVPPSNIPLDGIEIGVSVSAIAGKPLPIRIRQADRRRHFYIVGRTGGGKSSMLEMMAIQDIEAGRGVAIFDPNGDLVESIRARVPAHRADDVIVFDPADDERPLGLNILQARSDTERHRIATEFVEMLVRMYDPHQVGMAGPVFQHTTRMGLLTAMLGLPDATLIEAMRVLTSDAYARSLLPNISDPLVINFWEHEVKDWPPNYRGEIRTFIVSKFNRFIGDRRVRLITGQPRSSIDLRAVMDNKQILLVNLSKGRIGSQSATFLGFLILQTILIAALSRAEQSPEERDDFCLYIDEFQSFATETFTTMLSEGRKYGLALVMANQYLSQLTPDLRQAVFGNVGSLVSFRIGVGDAGLMAPEFMPVFGADDLINLPRYTTATRLMVDGQATRPFAMRTRLTTRRPDPALAEAIRHNSRMRYGRDAVEVDKAILERFNQASKGE